MRIPSSQALVSLLVLALFPLAACVDEKVVFEEPDDDPGEVPGAAAGFVGYSGHDAQLTYCGTCHVEKQAEWLKTLHSKAWSGLQESGHAQASCEACHSTNELGNAATKPSGYTATKDKRYEDVQCEACHGAGLQHIAAPSKSNIPKAPLATGTALSTGCGECHRSTMTPQLEEWAASQHSRLSALGSSAACTACHSGDGALKAWGVDTDFAEKQPIATGAVAVTCAVCHDPHGSTHAASLRFPVNTASLATNLCMRCHQERPGVDFAGMPHAAQGPILLGDAGWRPASLQGKVAATHGIVASNAGLCVTCHAATREVKDAAGAITFRDTGHRFWATPCVDASGKPLSASGCADSQRDYRSCTGAGCHGTQDVARSAVARANARTDALLAELAALLAKVPASEFSSVDGRTSAGEGSRYNRELALTKGATLHNPFLIEKLLLASIAELKRVYGIQGSSGVSLEPVLGKAGN
jgi:predicted CXXCH cytochrome family protein